MSGGGYGQSPMGGYGQSQYGFQRGRMSSPNSYGQDSPIPPWAQQNVPGMANSSPVPQPPTPPSGFIPPYQMPIFPGQSTTSQGGWARAGQGAGGYIPPQMPIFPGQTTTSEGGWTGAGQPRGGIPPVGGYNPMVGSQMNPAMPTQGPQMSQPYQATQQQAPVQQARPQQSFDQFAQTLSGSGMTSGQMQDAYQKSIGSSGGFRPAAPSTPTNPAIPQVNGQQYPGTAWDQRALGDPQWAWQQMLNQYAKEDAGRAPEGPYDAGAARLGLRAQFGR